MRRKFLIIGSGLLTLGSSVVSGRSETPKINSDSFPVVETTPQPGAVGQPRRVLNQNMISGSHQGKWGRFNWGNGEFAGFGPVGVYGVAPWAEDWSDLRDARNRHDLFDPLKFIALNDSKTIWLTFSGSSRVRNWVESRPQLGTANVRHSGRFSVMNLLSADLHLGQHVRLFSEVLNANAGGWRPYGYDSTWRRQIGLQQLFIELKGKLALAQTALMVGRQQFLDAPAWILYNRDTPDVPVSWNGVRAYALWNSFKLDAFNFIGTSLYNTHNFGGGFDETTRLYGINGAYALPDTYCGNYTLRSFFNFFWMGFRFGGRQARSEHRVGATSGTQTRQNIGFRWYGNLPDFEYDLGAVYQFGRFHGETGPDRSVSAYAIHTIMGWRHSRYWWHPFMGIQAELYSGGKLGRNRGSMNGFVAPFSPQAGSFDSTRSFGRSNVISISPVISATPISHFTIRLKAPFLWRERRSDAVYGVSGRYKLFQGSALRAAGQRIGVVPQGQILWQIDRHLSWQIDGGYVFLTRKMKNVGAKNESFMLSTLQFRF